VASFTADPSIQEIEFWWKDDVGKRIGSIRNLKQIVESKGRKLLFATNGGMFDPGFSPHGLFVQHGEILVGLDTQKAGAGNFYMQPNGVFRIGKDRYPAIRKTSDFVFDSTVAFATQSGPMLLVDGAINPLFVEGSKNLHVRSGVGILPDGKVLFAISKDEMNFHDFASYFRSKGCREALYLDGFVSEAYIPGKDRQDLDGDFGPLIGVTVPDLQPRGVRRGF